MKIKLEKVDKNFKGKWCPFYNYKIVKEENRKEEAIGNVTKFEFFIDTKTAFPKIRLHIKEKKGKKYVSKKVMLAVSSFECLEFFAEELLEASKESK